MGPRLSDGLLLRVGIVELGVSFPRVLYGSAIHVGLRLQRVFGCLVIQVLFKFKIATKGLRFRSWRFS